MNPLDLLMPKAPAIAAPTFANPGADADEELIQKIARAICAHISGTMQKLEPDIIEKFKSTNVKVPEDLSGPIIEKLQEKLVDNMVEFVEFTDKQIESFKENIIEKMNNDIKDILHEIIKKHPELLDSILKPESKPSTDKKKGGKSKKRKYRQYHKKTKKNGGNFMASLKDAAAGAAAAGADAAKTMDNAKGAMDSLTDVAADGAGILNNVKNAAGDALGSADGALGSAAGAFGAAASLIPGLNGSSKSEPKSEDSKPSDESSQHKFEAKIGELMQFQLDKILLEVKNILDSKNVNVDSIIEEVTKEKKEDIKEIITTTMTKSLDQIKERGIPIDRIYDLIADKMKPSLEELVSGLDEDFKSKLRDLYMEYKEVSPQTKPSALEESKNEEINSPTNKAAKVVKDVTSSSNGGKKTRKKRQSNKVSRY